MMLFFAFISFQCIVSCCLNNITFVCFFLASSGAAAVKSGAGSSLRGGPGVGQQPVQVVIKDSPIILAQVINSLRIIAVTNHLRHFSRWNERRFRKFSWGVRRVSDSYCPIRKLSRHEDMSSCLALALFSSSSQIYVMLL